LQLHRLSISLPKRANIPKLAIKPIAFLHRSKAPATAPPTLQEALRGLFSHGAKSDLGVVARVENSGGIQASLAGRYATALFELARDERQLEAVSGSLATLRQALRDSADLNELVTSPLISREDAAKAITASAGAMRLDPITSNFLGVVAQNRRLAQLPQIVRAFNMLAANHRGETTAEVTSAHPLTDDQVSALKSNLKTRLGRDVAVDLNVDPTILGGLVVKVGSQMIDGSIRTKLNSLAHAMKG
jgi:F-type H+-transporting ATPase subunit delta